MHRRRGRERETETRSGNDGGMTDRKRGEQVHKREWTGLRLRAKQDRWIDIKNRAKWVRYSEGKERRKEEIHKTGKSGSKREKNQFMEPNNCSRRSSTVHCISDDDPTLCDVACDCGRCGRILKDPESVPFDNVSIRRPICAELLKNTLVSGRFTVPCFFEDINEFMLPLEPDRPCSLKCS